MSPPQFVYNVAVRVKELQSGRGMWLFWAGLLLCTLYQSYRYPLQINSTGTSPTYSDTPPLLNAGKYILALPLLLIGAVRGFGKSGSPRHWTIALTTVFLSSYALLKLFGDAQPNYIDLAFWMLFPLVLVWAVDAVTIPAIDRFLRYLLVYAFGSTLVQVVLFLAIGRLPALAFEGTHLIRFGGFLDDPNGFAAVLFLLMGWSYKRFRGKARFCIVAGIVVCLLLTQSWTGVAFLLLATSVSGLVALSKKPVLAMATLCTATLISAFVVSTISRSHYEIAQEVLTEKEDSIEGHLFPLEKVADSWREWALEGNTTYATHESWWAGALVNFGAPWYCAWFGLIVALIISLQRGVTEAVSEAKPVYSGFFLFGAYFAFGSITLPYPIIFPANFFFFLFSFLVAFGKVRLENGLPSLRSRTVA